jgi:hypothetical protein
MGGHAVDSDTVFSNYQVSCCSWPWRIGVAANDTAQHPAVAGHSTKQLKTLQPQPYPSDYCDHCLCTEGGKLGDGKACIPVSSSIQLSLPSYYLHDPRCIPVHAYIRLRAYKIMYRIDIAALTRPMRLLPSFAGRHQQDIHRVSAV